MSSRSVNENQVIEVCFAVKVTMVVLKEKTKENTFVYTLGMASSGIGSS